MSNTFKNYCLDGIERLEAYIATKGFEQVSFTVKTEIIRTRLDKLLSDGDNEAKNLLERLTIIEEPYHRMKALMHLQKSDKDAKDGRYTGGDNMLAGIMIKRAEDAGTNPQTINLFYAMKLQAFQEGGVNLNPPIRKQY